MPKYYARGRRYKKRYYRKKRYGYRPYRKSYRRSYRYRTKYIGRSFTRPTARKLGALYKRMGMRSKFTPSRYTAVKRYKRNTKRSIVSKLRKKGVPANIANAAAGTVHMMNSSRNQRRIPSFAIPVEQSIWNQAIPRPPALIPGDVFQNYVTPPITIPGVRGSEQDLAAFNGAVAAAVASLEFDNDL